MSRPGSSTSTPTRLEALAAGVRRPDDRHHGHRVGKSLCFQLPTLEVLTADPTGPGALSVSDQGAGPGSGPLAAPLRAAQGDPPGDLRRRHAARRAGRDPQAQQPDHHQPGHAARRDPAPPRRVGRPVRQPGVRRRRRGPRLPRRVRLARRQRAAAAAARRRDPRHRAALPARQRHDRQPGRARRAAHRTRRPSTSSTTTPRPRRTRRVAMWNPPLLDEQLGVRASALYEAAEVFSELVSSRRPDDLLHEVTQGRRADPAPRRRPARAGAGRADRALPRRLHPRAATRDRAPADQAASCSGWSPPTRWSSGSTSASSTPPICVTFPGTVASLRQMWGRAGRRGRGLAVYIAGEDALDQFFCRHPDDFLARPVEAAILDPESPRDLCRAPAVRRARGAAAARPTSRSWARSGESTPRHSLPPGCCASAPPASCPARRRLPGGPGGAALGLGGQLRADRRRLRRGAGHDRGGARVLDGPRGRRLSPPGALLPGARARPRRAAARCWSRSTATTSPRPSARA